MGQGTAGELHVTYPLCAPVGVDTAELSDAARHLAATQVKLNRLMVALQLAEQSLQGTSGSPSDTVSAGPALAALREGMDGLRACAMTMESLGHRLSQAAQEYQGAENSIWQRFRAGVSTSVTWWQQHYDTWLPLPTDPFLAPSYRLVQAVGEAQLSSAIRHPLTTLATPRLGITTLFSAGLLKLSQLRRLSPQAWLQLAPDYFLSGQGLLTAFAPVRDSEASGLNRAESAEFIQRFARTLSPGRDPMGEASHGVAQVVDDIQSSLGHHQARVFRLAERPGDSDQRASRTFADAIAVIGELNIDQGAHAGELRIDKVTSEQGAVSWQVFIPGAQGLEPSRVNSLLHTARALDGNLSATSGVVLTAMRQAGVQKGEPVVMVGHSLGGMTGNLLANDPGVRAEFDIPLVITAGSPLDRQNLRSDTQLIAFEHVEDLVPGLDGVELQARANATTISRELHASSIPEEAAGRGPFHYHDYPTYIRTGALADSHPGLTDVRTLLTDIIPDGSVHTFRFRSFMSR